MARMDGLEGIHDMENHGDSERGNVQERNSPYGKFQWFIDALETSPITQQTWELSRKAGRSVQEVMKIFTDAAISFSDVPDSDVSLTVQNGLEFGVTPEMVKAALASPEFLTYVRAKLGAM